MTTRSITAIANGLDIGGQPDPEIIEAIHQEQGSKKFLILDALHRNGKAQTVGDLVHWTKGLDHGLNVREITRLLWALQKMGYVRFTERHAGNATELTKINLTPLAVKDIWPLERKQREPVEKIDKPRKPKIVPATEYKVPEPPRYAAPEPPAQNTKSSTDVESGGNPVVVHEVDMQVHATDTHTQYLSEMAVPYKNSPGTATSRQRVLRFLRDVITTIPTSKLGDWIAYSDLKEKMGMKSGNTSVLVKSANEFDYVDMLSHTGQNLTSFRITDVGRRDIDAFYDVLDVKLSRKKVPAEKPIFRGHAPQDQSILDLEKPGRGNPPGALVAAMDELDRQDKTARPMEVVRRDEADAEKKSTSTGDAMNQFTYGPGTSNSIEPPLDLTDYPLLVELLAKETKAGRYQQAAEILMELDENTALNLLGRVEITPTEREMISFIKRVVG